jgi:hypothetical protein
VKVLPWLGTLTMGALILGGCANGAPPGAHALAATGDPDGGFDGNHLQDGFYFLTATIPW